MAEWFDDIDSVNNAFLVAKGYVEGKGIPIKKVVKELIKSFNLSDKDARMLQKMLIEDELKVLEFPDLLNLYTDAVDASRKQSNEIRGWDADVAVEVLKEVMTHRAMGE